MANNNLMGAEESLNIHEAFVVKYQKPIIIAVLAIIIVIAGIFAYKNRRFF